MTLQEKINAIYKKIPPIKCKKKCFAACGPIAMSESEQKNLMEILGKYPFEAAGYEMRNCLTCPWLNPKKNTCNNYEIRPAICRMYGVVKRLKCPNGCRPKRWMKDKEVGEIFGELNRLGE